MQGDVPPDVVFSLVCEHCDAGMEIETYEDAMNLGWSEISYEPDCPMANFIGLCPECRQREEA
jgi:hypothetical protein